MDLAVGAKEYEPGSVASLGAVFVFFGPLTAAAISAGVGGSNAVSRFIFAEAS